ncbi:MAG: hypothetical protein ACI8S6_005344 [Myxococcota bacterium]|jgi:hypothetical protein
MPTPSAHERIQALYDQTHGIPLEDVDPGEGPVDGDDLDAYWKAFWVALRFDTAEAVGSSRLMQLALVHSNAGASSPRAMLLALLRLLGDREVPASGPLDYFMKLLSIECRQNPERYREAVGFTDHIDPQELHAGQALMARWFISPDLDTVDERWDTLTAVARWPR